ncbi:MAG: ArsA family ATPase [Actinobacteria bacterium]|nr:ArsA family ATPase [Actinomycetota bacterium]
MRGREPAGHRPALRRPPAAVRGAQDRRRPRWRGRLRPGDRAQGRAPGVPRAVLPARPGGQDARAPRGRRLRDDDRAGRARRPAHRQGLRGRPPPREDRAGLRRRRPRRTAHGPDHPVPQRQRRGRRPREGRPGPQPGRLDHEPAAQPADRRPPRDGPGGDACAGDPGRRRPAARGRAAGRRGRRQHGARPGPAAAQPHRRREGPAGPRRGRGGPGVRRARRPVRDPRRRAARRGRRARAAGRARVGPAQGARGPRAAGLRAAGAVGGHRPRCPVRLRRGATGAGHGVTEKRTARPAKTSSGRRSAPLDVDALLDDPATRVIVCCGSGGVGKTTTAAALGLRAAERGRRVVVLTIDPARRLAQSMGLVELDNAPRPVRGADTAAGGSLDAMMLDMKRTFDEVIEAHATPEKAEQILANPFYQALSSSFAGTQEYMAMEKLGQLRTRAEAAKAAGRTDEAWDLIVVDTPPSRSALDFLDAPQRLGSFLDGRFIRILSAPAKAGGRAYLKVVSLAVGTAGNVMTKILGAGFLTDVQTFVSALDTMFGGFRERADRTYRLLQAEGTAFVVVAAPEPDALREASYFVERLGAERMPLAGLVLNRVHVALAEDLSADRAAAAAEDLDAAGGQALTAGLLRVHADRMRRRDRDRSLAVRFTSAHPTVPVVEVPARAEDVHDLEGLRAVGADLSKG